MIEISRPECPHPAALQAGNYGHHRNKDALRLANSDKCMYCESKISHIDHAHIEHIKPKAANKYPELEFIWDNLGYACAVCNVWKGDNYFEDCVYLDPYSEDPATKLFAFGAFLYARNGSERAEKTIADIKLNRVELLEARLRKIEGIEKALLACHRTKDDGLRQRAIDELGSYAQASEEYSLCISALLELHG